MKAILCALSILAVAGRTAALAMGGGYADYNGTTTGGDGGTTTTVTSVSDFLSQIGDGTRRVIQFSNTFNLGTADVDLKSNKSILGLGTNATLIGDLRLKTVTNVVIRNVFFTNPSRVGDGDGLTVQYSTERVWVDHCTFRDCGDGSADFTHATDFVTLSWSEFLYTSNSTHNFVNLIGHTDNNCSEDCGKLHITFHHNWWSTLCIERMPRVRYGRIHTYNNYFNCSVNGIITNNYCIRAAISSEVFAVKNVFENISTPYEYYLAGGGQGLIKAVSNATINCSNVNSFDDPVFTPPYSDPMHETNLVAGIVTNNAGAGRVPRAIFTATPTTGPAPLAVTFTNLSTGLITNQLWNFGDSATTNTTNSVVSHTYSAGAYTVIVTASGYAGSGVTTQSNYIVATSGGTAPTASFTASPTNGVEPLTVTFTDTSTGTAPLSLFWDLGDTFTTNTADGASFTHAYAAGTYTVTLTASNSAGASTLVSNNLITSFTPFQAWQQQFFGCTGCQEAQADADPDGDGMTNTNEFLAGTNPTNGLSALRIVSAVQQGDNVQITWTTAGGRTNAVQATAGDVNGNYSTNFEDIAPAPHVVIPGSGDFTTNYIDEGGATNVPSRFYRVRLVP
jgi:pectate lyase